MRNSILLLHVNTQSFEDAEDCHTTVLQGYDLSWVLSLSESFHFVTLRLSHIWCESRTKILNGSQIWDSLFQILHLIENFSINHNKTTVIQIHQTHPHVQ